MIPSDLTVLEVGEYVAAPYAGKALSDLGATVIKVEPPDGDVARRVAPFLDRTPGVDRSGFFGYLNTGKRSATLARDGAAPRVLCDLVGTHDVDVVIGDSPTFDAYGVEPATLSDAFERTSVVSISGFGATGPFQEYAAPDLIAWAESGQMNKMGYPEGPPTRPRIKSTDYWAGQVAFIAALAALLYRDRGGDDGQFVDVSKRETATSMMEFFVAGYSWSGSTAERTGNGYARQPPRDAVASIYEAADGHITSAPHLGSFWEVFCERALERPELAEDDRFATQAARSRNGEETTRLINEHTRQHEKWELFEELQGMGVPTGVTMRPDEVAGFDHLRERDFWQEVPLPNGAEVTMPGFPFRPGGPEAPVEMERAPRLGEHTAEVFAPLEYGSGAPASTSRVDGRGPAPSEASERDPDAGGTLPLDGVKVLDFTWVYAGPHCTKFLAALGADVVKVESRRKLDFVRTGSGFGFDAGPENPDVSAYFNEHNQGKRGVTVDLTSEEGREVALELAAEADVVIEGFAPGFMERVALTYEDVSDVNGDVVYLSMPGWGRTGPVRDYSSFGSNLQSMAGMDYISGFPDDPPTTPGFSWPDPASGFAAVMAALAALYRREHADEGSYVEVPQYETTVTFLHKPVMEWTMNGRVAERVGNRDEDRRFVQGAYPCAGEDRWAVVAIETDAQWERLCDAMGLPELADDERFASQYDRLAHHDAVDDVVREWTRGRTPEEVRYRLQDRDVPAGIVADERDLVDYDPQLRARGYFAEHDHPEVGEQTYQGVPFEMGACDVRFSSRAPLLGEHTEEVLAEWLGLSEDEIGEMRDARALY